MAVALAGVYSLVISWGMNDIVSIAVVNTLLSVPLVISLWRRSDPSDHSSLISRQSSFFAAIWPAALILGLALAGSWLTRLQISSPWKAARAVDLGEFCRAIVWIPIVEEVVFRAGFGGVLRSAGGKLLGGYTSALFFGMMHSMPPPSNVPALRSFTRRIDTIRTIQIQR